MGQSAVAETVPTADPPLTESVDLSALKTDSPTNLPSETALEAAPSQLASESVVESNQIDSRAILAGQGLSQKEFIARFGPTAPTINRWLEKRIFEEKSRQPDGSYFRKIGDLYYQIFPSEKSP